MHILHSSRDLAAPKDAVWALIADYGQIQRWWSADAPIQIERVVLEGQGVGQVRHIYFPRATVPVSERLDHLDPERGIWKLSIVGQRPAGLTSYEAIGRLSALPGGGSHIDYSSEFTTDDDGEQARAFLLTAYEWMYRGLEAAAQA